jgi:hypothetical protein
MTVEADEQRHQGRVDALETEIAADDIVDTTVVGAGHANNESKNEFRQETADDAQCKDVQQMDIGLPLPYFESKGFEDGYCQHHEGATDDAYVDGFFMSFVHTGGKGNKNM